MNWRRQAFLLGHDLIGSRLRAHYEEFLSVGNWPVKRLEALHQKRLHTLLDHAIKAIPFYRERVATPELSAFPILRKEDMKAHFADLMESSLRAEYQAANRTRGYSWTEVKTGGSTGTPTAVIHDRNFRDWGRAGRLYSQFLCGFLLGTPFFLLWGSMRDLSETKDSPQKRLLQSLLQAHPLNAFRMDAGRMAEYAREIQESSVNHLMAYIDAAEELARFIEQHGKKMRPLDSIMACAGVVTQEARATLGRVFGARVHNKYGSRECADLACECAAGGFHIYHTGVHLEIVDPQGDPVPIGTSGRILVTLLHNRRFPLVRYEIGDVGAFRAGPCPCGSPLPLLARVEGRTFETITAASGEFVSPVLIRHLVGVVHHSSALEKFQFVQAGAATYSLALQMDAALSELDFEQLAARLRTDLEKVLGSGAALDIRRVTNIPPGESGKFLYVQNLHRASPHHG